MAKVRAEESTSVSRGILGQGLAPPRAQAGLGASCMICEEGRIEQLLSAIPVWARYCIKQVDCEKETILRLNGN